MVRDLIRVVLIVGIMLELAIYFGGDGRAPLHEGKHRGSYNAV